MLYATVTESKYPYAIDLREMVYATVSESKYLHATDLREMLYATVSESKYPCYWLIVYVAG
jgi:hypothetical protein